MLLGGKGFGGDVKFKPFWKQERGTETQIAKGVQNT